MKDFLNLPGDASHSSFHGLSCASDSLAFTENLDLQYLSDELDIAITDHGEIPGVDVSLLLLSLVELRSNRFLCLTGILESSCKD